MLVPYTYNRFNFEDMFDLLFKAQGVPDETVKFQRKEDSYSYRVEIPGAESKDVDIEAIEDYLLVKANIVDEDHKVSFSKKLYLPKDTDPGKIVASMKNGVLKLSIGKREDFKPKKIKVES